MVALAYALLLLVTSSMTWGLTDLTRPVMVAGKQQESGQLLLRGEPCSQGLGLALTDFSAQTPI